MSDSEPIRDTLEVYRPHSKRWLEQEIGDCNSDLVDSLAHMFAGCYADGEMAAERKARRSALAADQKN